MADWDADSPEMKANLAAVSHDVRAAAFARIVPETGLARAWHRRVMRDLDVPNLMFVGQFRGEAGLEFINVAVGPNVGVPAGDVSMALVQFESRLQAAVVAFDARIPVGGMPDDGETLAAVIDLVSWVHAEWVRIHPFANGNGRTARLWANFIAMRYGLPAFVRLRPRPGGAYGSAGAAAMSGNWRATVPVFRQLYLDELAARRADARPN
ncbi:MAG: Fic family protein [Rhodobacteraceae bacterium]|nr:Fic family protein [Paracoccaceae bacterium]